MKTLLNAVNEVLKRVRIISGDSGELTSLTDPARQNYIDIAVQVINEGIEELYTTSDTPMPLELSSDTIVLKTDIRAYDLANNLVQLHYPLINRANTQFIQEFRGGYLGILKADPEQDDTGQPLGAAISPETEELYLDRAPTSAENGDIYTYQYDRDVSLEKVTDTVPFKDIVFRAMVPAWAELWKRDQRNSFDGDVFKTQIGRGARALSQGQQRTSWLNR